MQDELRNTSYFRESFWMAPHFADNGKIFYAFVIFVLLFILALMDNFFKY